MFILAAAMALMDIENIDAEAVARKSMKIAGDMCVYTNNNLTVEILDITKKETPSSPSLPTAPIPLPSSPPEIVENK